MPSPPRSRSRWKTLGPIAGVMVLLVTFVTRRAGAAQETRPVREAIVVEPGATCLGAAALVEQVEAWVGTDRVDSDVVVDVRGSPDHPRDAGFQMLRAGSIVAVRRFEPGPSRCEQLHAVLGLAIAMALKASLVEELAPTMVPMPVLAPAVPPGPPVQATPPWSVVADAIVAVAVLPDAAFGFDARIERALSPVFGLRLGLLGVLAHGEAFSGVPGHFDEWLLAPRLDLCAGLELGSRVRMHGCMGMSGGGLHAQGYSYASSRSTFIRWLAVANELGVAVDLSRHWSIGASAALILPVARNSIVLRDYSENVLEQRDLAPVGWIFGVGPMLRF
jgi:hypothetical protein